MARWKGEGVDAKRGRVGLFGFVPGFVVIQSRGSHGFYGMTRKDNVDVLYVL